MKRLLTSLLALAFLSHFATAQQPLRLYNKTLFNQLIKSYNSVSYDDSMLGLYRVSKQIDKNSSFCGIVDHNGEIVVPVEYESIYIAFGEYVSGYYPYIEARKKKKIYDVYSLDGKKIISNYKVKRSISYYKNNGFYDGRMEDKDKIPHTLWVDINGYASNERPNYHIKEVKDSLSQIYGKENVTWNSYDYIYTCRKNSAKLLHNKDGEFLFSIPTKVYRIFIQDREFLGVEDTDGKKGLYTLHGKELIPMKYYFVGLDGQSIINGWHCKPPYFTCYPESINDKSTAIYDMQGIQLIAPYYGKPYYDYYSGDGFRIELSKNRYHYLQIYLNDDGTLSQRTEALADVTPQVFFENKYDPAEAQYTQQQAEAARQQRREALIQLTNALSGLAINVMNAVNGTQNSTNTYQSNTVTRSATTSTATTTTSTAGLSADARTKIRECQTNYNEWSKKVTNWIKIFQEEQVWFAANNKVSSSSWNPGELTSHQRRRSDALSQIKSCLGSMQNQRKLAALSGGTILKSAAEAQAEACTKETLE